MFADDNYNIIRYEEDSIAALLNVYEKFCEVSGSKVAPHKTECLRLSYSEDTGVRSKFGLKNTEAGVPIRILGCPIGLGLTPHQCFTWIQAKIEAKVRAGAHLRLSLLGRLIVLQHVLMALPMYVATLMHFSATDWKRIEKIFRDFLAICI